MSLLVQANRCGSTPHSVHNPAEQGTPAAEHALGLSYAGSPTTVMGLGLG